MLFLLSARARRRIRRFVDANFYVNRYDHRREWLRTSKSLGGELTEAEIVERVRGLVVDSVDPAFAAAFAVLVIFKAPAATALVVAAVLAVVGTVGFVQEIMGTREVALWQKMRIMEYGI